MVIFYSALIMVLSYGLILLITRMVTLIILMITSSLAFASYLIPKYGDSLWNKWWGSLINNALFAPIFMLMLWATVKIIGGLTSGVSNKEGTLSNLAKGDGGAWNLIFGLMIIVGLLYASTKIGSELAIAGEKFAKKVGMKGFTTGLRAGCFGVALHGGLIARNKLAGGVGRVASHIPGLRGVGAQLNEMSKKKHFSDTAAGKQASKFGMSFGSDQSADIAKHLAEIESAKATKQMKEKQKNETGILDNKIETAQTQLHDATGRSSDLSQKKKTDSETLTSIVSKEREHNAKLQNKESENNTLKNELGALERDLNQSKQSANPNVDIIKKTEQAIIAKNTEISNVSASIANLADTINDTSAERKIAEEAYEKSNEAVEINDTRKNRAKFVLEGRRKERENVSSTTYFKNGSQKIVEQNIDRRFFIGGGKSIKEVAKKEANKSEINRIAEAISKLPSTENNNPKKDNE